MLAGVQDIKLVYGAHAAGKTTFVGSVQPSCNIGSRSFTPTQSFKWESYFSKPGIYEVAPMLPGSISLFDPYNKTASIDSIDFKNLVPPPKSFSFIHVEPPFDIHFTRYMNRDGKRLGLSEKSATQFLTKLRKYYKNLSQVLSTYGSTVHTLWV